MKVNRILIALVLFNLVFNIGCHKEGNTTLCSEDQFICSPGFHHDSATLHKTIIGIWEWKYISYARNYANSNCTEFKDNTIEFLENGAVYSKAKGVTSAESKWSIEVIDTTTNLKIDPVIGALNGWLVICEGKLGVLQSQYDGPNNYYFKKN